MGRTVVISACTGYITTDEDVADTAGEWAPSIPLPFTLSPFFVLRSNERASAHAPCYEREPRLISQSKSKNSVVKCTPGEACTLGTDRGRVTEGCVGVGWKREGGARNSLPVLERKSRIAEYNRRPISREGERERESKERIRDWDRKRVY